MKVAPTIPKSKGLRHLKQELMKSSSALFHITYTHGAGIDDIEASKLASRMDIQPNLEEPLGTEDLKKTMKKFEIFNKFETH